MKAYKEIGILSLVLLALNLSADTRKWDGGGGTTHWSDAGNWDGNNNLLAADLIEFPPNINKLTAENDFPHGTQFGLITFSGPGYHISGNTLTTMDGLNVTHGQGITTFEAPIWVSVADQTFMVNNNQARLRLLGNITPASPSIELTFDGAGRIDVSKIVTPDIVIGAYTFQKLGSGLLSVQETVGLGQGLNAQAGIVQIVGSTKLACSLHVGAQLTGWGGLDTINASQYGGLVFPGGLGMPLSVSNWVLLDHADATFSVALGGTGQGEYSQLRVVGPVIELGGPNGNCSLQIVNGRSSYVPAIGHAYRIIDNQGANSIAGTFANLPEGGETVFNGRHYTITYHGGTGNDVVLTLADVDSTGATRVWDGGGADSLWTTAENWVGDMAPNPGDDLVFPPGAAQLSNDNDYPMGVLFNSIALTGSGYTLNGNRVILRAGLESSHPSGLNVVAIPLRLGADQSFSKSGAGGLNLIGGMQLNGYDLDFQVDGGPITASGAISGLGTIDKYGFGELILSGGNSYFGLTRVFEGQLKVGNANALGQTFAGTEVMDPGSLEISGGITIGEPLTLSGDGDGINGALVSTSGANEIFGPITLAGDVTLGTISQLTLSGAITGPFALQKSGQQKLVLSGAEDNTYTGTTLVRSGEIELLKSPPHLAIVGPLVIGDNNGPNLAIVRATGSSQIHGSIPVTIQTDGKLVANVFEMIGSLEGSGSVEFTGVTPELRVGFNNASTEFSGPINGATGTFTKFGSGELILSGTCSHHRTYVNAGTLRINGTHNTPAWALTGGTLRGNGTIGGNLTVSDGTLHPGPGGVLDVSGNLQADPSSTFVFDLDGALPCGLGTGLLNVNGTVSLNGAALTINMDPAFVPSPNTQVTLIHDPSLTGTFNGLPPGDQINGFYISYTGCNTTHDVTLTMGAAVAAPMMLSGGEARLSGRGRPGQAYVLQATESLVSPIRWTDVDSARADRDGNFALSDPEARHFLMRFYRVKEL